MHSSKAQIKQRKGADALQESIAGGSENEGLQGDWVILSRGRMGLLDQSAFRSGRHLAIPE